MAKRTRCLKLERLLLRAEQEKPDVYRKAVRELGIGNERSTADLAKLLRSVEPDVVEKVIESLREFEGPSETISPKYHIQSESWQKHFDAIWEDADPDILVRAIELTSPENVHKLNMAKGYEESRFNLYVSLSLKLMYDESTGFVTGVTRQEFHEVLLPRIRIEVRIRALERFVSECPPGKFRLEARRKIAESFCRSKSLHNCLLHLKWKFGEWKRGDQLKPRKKKQVYAHEVMKAIELLRAEGLAA